MRSERARPQWTRSRWPHPPLAIDTPAACSRRRPSGWVSAMRPGMIAVALAWRRALGSAALFRSSVLNRTARYTEPVFLGWAMPMPWAAAAPTPAVKAA